MTLLPNGVLILFSAVSLIAFLWYFIRGKEWQKLTPHEIFGSLKVFAAVLLPFACLFWAAGLPGLQVANGIVYFVGTAFFAYVLGQMNLLPWLRGLLLLAASVILTTHISSDNYQIPLLSSLAGFLVWKSAENLLEKPSSTLEDILPAFTWLAGAYWVKVSALSAHPEFDLGVLLGTLAISILLRWIQSPFMSDDKFQLKKIILSASGGLGVLIVIMKLLVVPSMAKIALLAGGGYLLAYLLNDKPEDKLNNKKDPEETPPVFRALGELILIGIAMLVATRLPFGMLGLLILGATAVVAPRRGIAQIAGLFFVCRVLLQAFIFQYNPNVTGINILHPYVTAALFAGLTLAIVASLLFRDLKHQNILISAFLLLSTVPVCLANYFLHEEPTGSFLVAILVAVLLMAVFGPVIYGSPPRGHENIIVLPALLITTGLLANEIIVMGNEATIHQKLIVIGAMGALTLALLIFKRIGCSGLCKGEASA